MNAVRINHILLVLIIILISGCGGGNHYAPVADISTLLNQLQTEYHEPKELARKVTKTNSTSYSSMYRVHHNSRDWQWPTQGQIIKAYSPASKGVDIANRLGEPIYAAGAGKVVYSGSGIRGYGNLIIIKHKNAYMTAYAHNSRVYVKSGQFVTKGQKIAEMGQSDSTRVKLYFQVRYRGRAINPNTLF